MNKIIVKADADNLVLPTKKNKRGARVYGLPVSRELASYIEDVSPEAQQHRLLSMFFAGNFAPVSIVEPQDEDDGDF